MSWIYCVGATFLTNVGFLSNIFLFNGYNDSLDHADALARLLKGMDCRVNLIRFHAIPGVTLKSTDMQSMEAFRDRLNNRGVVATIRASRGEDIFAACGMLSTAEKNKK